MNLNAKLTQISDKIENYLCIINKTRNLFKYFVIHHLNKLDIDIIKTHIFYHVFTSDYMFCKYLENSALSQYDRLNIGGGNYVLINNICIKIRNQSNIIIETNISKNNIIQENYNAYIPLHAFYNHIYDFIKSKNFKFDAQYDILKNKFMIQLNDLKISQNILKKQIIERNKVINILKNYNTDIIIIKYIYSGNIKYIYSKFHEFTDNRVIIEYDVEPNYNNILQIDIPIIINNKFLYDYIHIDYIYKIINPYDINPEFLINGSISYNILDEI